MWMLVLVSHYLAQWEVSGIIVFFAIGTFFSSQKYILHDIEHILNPNQA